MGTTLHAIVERKVRNYWQSLAQFDFDKDYEAMSALTDCPDVKPIRAGRRNDLQEEWSIRTAEELRIEAGHDFVWCDARLVPAAPKAYPEWELFRKFCQALDSRVPEVDLEPTLVRAVFFRL